MCGIVGIVYQGSHAVEREILEGMNSAILHRGPDEDGFFLKENVGLGMRRLAIIDLASGQQPIFNHDKSKVIVFNGEIYNFQELRADLESRGHQFKTNSDTEAIIHLYDEFGVDCVQHLRGMFAFAIWDEREKSLFLARDRVGKKPILYSHQTNGNLIFGSEFNALLQHPSVSREVDFSAIDSYLTYLCVPAPQTAFKQIRKLEPAHWLLWKNGEIKTQRYWQPDFSKKIKISEEEAIEETTRILRESVKLRMISEVPLGAFLSGGVDSSAVVALMAETSSQPVKTFSIGFEEEDFSELKYAKTVANHVGAEYNEFIVRPNALEVLPTLVEHYGEPYADSSAIPTYYVSKETRKYVTVALNGDGGDESFAGYERYVAMNLAEKYRKIPKVLRKGLIETSVGLLPNPKQFRSRVKSLKRFVESGSLDNVERYLGWMSAISPSLKTELVSNQFKSHLNGTKPIDVLQKWFDKTENLNIIDATMLTDQMTYLPNDLLVKVDIASMANSLEARSPLLDHHIIEFAASLPQHLKVSGKETKYLLKKIAAKLVPKEVIYRRKMGFGVPIGKWLRNEMKDFVKENLLSERFAKRGLFQQNKIADIIQQHNEQKNDFGTQIWTLLMLELWFQRFID
ncbi:MAG: asparagine synthase (glutamine-hydrolyzing) [Pyrinomonadaceae bacterium]|nr:asparagine synthase (glutamine-hydrolyzing) [Pyrinomonadaceae bacterium]